ncbi:cell division protein FtsN [Brevibacillus panacihumi W25]|uniref:Cell division protein FtsN n=1 Tax=Brevibacillus panacihumi W25 TaxID=1408254 RepID=V6MG89_9BACL|nr:TasA family protein [Brevibacillus panacihumi]EST54428.1 cell division protein FtsN [Brevibacillus panacihumi W25]
MNLKKQFAMTLASVGLGAALIGGGTFAYFNATTSIDNNTFAAGTLKIGATPASAVFDVNNLKPGDWMERTFKIKNEGTLDVDKLLMGLEYTIVDVGEDQLDDDDFAKNLKVYFLSSDNKSIPFDDRVILSPLNGKTLKQLKDGGQLDISSWGTRWQHLKPGVNEEIYIGIKFEDDGKDQNRFQGDSVSLKFNLEGKQTAGQGR